ncbi:MAG TPA: DGQHR domain-containing protein DpdB, partial [Longimicrobiaceae bacterium]
MPNTTELRLPALEIRQGPHRVLYSFAVDGKLLPDFTTISRIHRDSEREIQGYQRPEVLSHIAEIRNYLESERPMIPNSIVVAFDPRVRFEASDVQPFGSGYSRVGAIVIPLDTSLPDEKKPGWIVDGQQRCAAIREAQVERFPICVTAFITADDQEQTEQFILVNSTKPLPKGLIYELLPGTESRLPSPLQKRRFPAVLLERLNFDPDSPFRGLVQTPTSPEGVVKDNSILKMLENSLNEGALHRFRDPSSGRGNVDAMLTLVKAFWQAVKEVFPDAWGEKPRRSRLMHGVGIVSLGFVMDAIADRYLDERIPTTDDFREDLLPLREVCRWKSGTWDFGPGMQRRWNELQNTSKDIIL